MKKVSATELKTRTGECLDTAQKEPVEVEKNGRTVAFLIASDEYNRLSNLEREYWMARVGIAEKSGYVGSKE